LISTIKINTISYSTNLIIIERVLYYLQFMRNIVLTNYLSKLENEIFQSKKTFKFCYCKTKYNICSTVLHLYSKEYRYRLRATDLRARMFSCATVVKKETM
jgi:hypothetical protein